MVITDKLPKGGVCMEIVYAMGFTQQKALENLDALALKISEHMFKLCSIFTNKNQMH